MTTRRPQDDPWRLLEPQHPQPKGDAKRRQEALQRLYKVDLVSFALKCAALALIAMIVVMTIWFSHRLHHLQPIAVYNEPAIHSR
jgi:hypothetical protein